MTDEQMVASLPGLAFAFGLVLSRASMVVMLLPGLGETEPPAIVRAGLALAVSLLLLPIVSDRVAEVPNGWDGAAMIAAELLTGAMLGWLARLPVMALSMAGALVSTMVGLSSVLQPDPALGGQSSALARLFGLLATVTVLSTGLYSLPLEALAGSYDLIAPGAVLPAGPMVETIQEAASASLGLALRLAAPFVLASLVVQASLGLLARLVPQLQVFTAATPGQILGGLAMVGLLAAPLTSTWLQSVAAAWAVLPGL